MMDFPRALRLRLHGEPVATLVEHGSGGDSLAYDLSFEREWIDRPLRPTLTLAALNWRLEPTRRFIGRMPPFLTNLLLERDGGLRRRIARAAGIDERDDLALLGFVGRDLSGAITADPFDPPPRAGRIVEHSLPVSGTALRWRWSLGGVQLKFSVDRTDRLTLPVESGRGRWILKVPEPTRPELPRAELAAMLWAGASGFDVPVLEVVDPREVDGIPADAVENTPQALLVRRFDRLEDHTPVHMEELASVLEVHPEDKYADHGGPHAAKQLVYVGRVIRRFVSEPAVEELVRRVVFDVLVGNGDAHLKNWALLFPDGRTPRLAPVYDVVPTVLFGYPEQLALRFAGGKAFRAVTWTRIRQFARKVGADPEAVVRAALDTIDRATSSFDAAMRQAQLSAASTARLRAHWEALPLVRTRP